MLSLLVCLLRNLKKCGSAQWFNFTIKLINKKLEGCTFKKDGGYNYRVEKGNRGKELGAHIKENNPFTLLRDSSYL